MYYDFDKLYERCHTCKGLMHGVYASEKPVRKVCETCGGNTTEFNNENRMPRE